MRLAKPVICPKRPSLDATGRLIYISHILISQLLYQFDVFYDKSFQSVNFLFIKFRESYAGPATSSNSIQASTSKGSQTQSCTKTGIKRKADSEDVGRPQTDSEHHKSSDGDRKRSRRSDQTQSYGHLAKGQEEDGEW